MDVIIFNKNYAATAQLSSNYILVVIRVRACVGGGL